MDALQNLEVWKRACRLSVRLYLETAACPDRGFRSQVTRAGLSIPSNIAEGYERDGNRECARFMRMARGSCGELWTQLWIGAEAGLLDRDTVQELAAETRELSKMLRGLIKFYRLRSGG